MASRRGNQRKYDSDNPIQQALIRRFNRQVVECVHRVAPRTILDVGCGEGQVLDVLDRHGVRAALTGVDVCGPAVDDARRRLGARADIEQRDAHALAGDGRVFDLVMMLEVLEHLPRPGRVLPVLERLSRRYLLLSVPWEPLFRGLNLLRGRNVRAWGNDPEHVNHWSRGRFLRFVERRFTILQTPMVAPWTLVLAERRGS